MSDPIIGQDTRGTRDELKAENKETSGNQAVKERLTPDAQGNQKKGGLFLSYTVSFCDIFAK